MIPATAAHKLVRLPNGLDSVWSQAYGETMHPGLGPEAEAEHLHLGQLKIRERLRSPSNEFVVWDVGLGAAANAVTLLRRTRTASLHLQVVSFDDTLEPLNFALQQSEALGYLRGYEHIAQALIKQTAVEFTEDERSVKWRVLVADFPSLLATPGAALLPKPHGIMFDAFSPARNPAMWTLPVFQNLFRLLDPARGCVLTTYSRSTMVRVALLLAGFFVGRGHPTGLKEETTVAANDPGLLDDPLDRSWLKRAFVSSSAEPMTDGAYRRSPLTDVSRERLCAHRQFA
jgi:queuine tRNA-ribosyltransferase